jgi:manganese efflux pump family protein
MDPYMLVAIALGLSLDAFTVSLTQSMVTRDLHLRHGLRMAIGFGLFQFMMPVIGWAAGSTFSGYIEDFDHWIAFGLLTFVGGRMILDSLAGRGRKKEACDECRQDCTKFSVLLILAIATSIDALAVGLSFAMLDVGIILPSLVIGGITFLVCLAGFFLGKRLGERIRVNLEIVGGIVLLGIGVKILIEHLL